MKDISFDGLSSCSFEEFCFDLLHASGFVNVDWRKGTGLSTSPADKGRDIVCDRPRSEPDGSRHFEKWFFDWGQPAGPVLTKNRALTHDPRSARAIQDL